MSTKYAHTLIININRKKSENLDLLAKIPFGLNLSFYSAFWKSGFQCVLSKRAVHHLVSFYFHGPKFKEIACAYCFWLVCLCILNLKQMVLNNNICKMVTQIILNSSK